MEGPLRGCLASAAGIIFNGANLRVVNNGDNTLMKVSASSGTILVTYATGKGPFA